MSKNNDNLSCALVAIAFAIAFIGFCWSVAYRDVEIERLKHQTELKKDK